MPPLCRDLDHHMLLNIAHRHARLTCTVRLHQIGVPRGAALAGGCRGRGRPLPPPAQGTCMAHGEYSELLLRPYALAHLKQLPKAALSPSQQALNIAAM